jgi:hypothetical protein
MSVQDFKQIRAAVLTTAHDMDPDAYATPSDLLADFAAQVGNALDELPEAQRAELLDEALALINSKYAHPEPRDDEEADMPAPRRNLKNLRASGAYRPDSESWITWIFLAPARYELWVAYMNGGWGSGRRYRSPAMLWIIAVLFWIAFGYIAFIGISALLAKHSG